MTSTSATTSTRPGGSIATARLISARVSLRAASSGAACDELERARGGAASAPETKPAQNHPETSKHFAPPNASRRKGPTASARRRTQSTRARAHARVFSAAGPPLSPDALRGGGSKHDDRRSVREDIAEGPRGQHQRLSFHRGRGPIVRRWHRRVIERRPARVRSRRRRRLVETSPRRVVVAVVRPSDAGSHEGRGRRRLVHGSRLRRARGRPATGRTGDDGGDQHSEPPAAVS